MYSSRYEGGTGSYGSFSVPFLEGKILFVSRIGQCNQVWGIDYHKLQLLMLQFYNSTILTTL